MKLYLAALVLASAPVMPSAAASVIQPEEWQGYVEAYVEDSGRVIDTANGNISHSESQGYGLLLAVLAEDRAAFERIWSFTSTELLVRDDGLAAWRWEPDATPHITDINNATDGDILIAYALHRAGTLWNEARFTDAAAGIVGTVGRTMLVTADGLPAILPGAVGFAGNDANPAPILNPSYWIFETAPTFREVDPVVDWAAVNDTGLELLRRAAETEAGIPSDWVQLADGGISPAPDFPPEFGYNNIRIPLYLMRAGVDPSYLEPFRRNADAEGLYKVDVTTGERIEPIREPGYRLIQAGMECVAEGTVVPEELRTLSVTSYYAATLQLLMLDYLRREQGQCMEANP